MATTWGHFVVKCEIFHIYAEKKEKKKTFFKRFYEIWHMCCHLKLRTTTKVLLISDLRKRPPAILNIKKNNNNGAIISYKAQKKLF